MTYLKKYLISRGPTAWLGANNSTVKIPMNALIFDSEDEALEYVCRDTTVIEIMVRVECFLVGGDL